MVTAKKELKPLPGFSQNVNDNSALRMKKLARPICPYSKLVMKKDTDGKWVREEGSGLQNCQLRGPGWWLVCEELGHNPYWTERVWYEYVDILGSDPDVPGQEIVVETKKVKKTRRTPNVTQVAVAMRINNGLGVREAKNNKGFRELNEIGFEKCCQFRNCQKPVLRKWSSPTMGEYCSANHFELIAADQFGEMLHEKPEKTNLAGDQAEKIHQLRRQQLNMSRGYVIDRGEDE